MAATPTLTAASPLARTSAPAPAFDALVASLSRGDDVDVALAAAVCQQAGKSMSDLAEAVRRRAAELRP